MAYEETFRWYRKIHAQELRPYVAGESLAGIAISPEDFKAGSPQVGDFIARNTANPQDQWLVSAAFVRANYERVVS